MTMRHGAPTPHCPTSGGRTPHTAPCCCMPRHAPPHTMCTMPPPPRIAPCRHTPHHHTPHHHTPCHALHHDATRHVERPKTTRCPTPHRLMLGGHTPCTAPRCRTPHRALRHDTTQHIE